MNPYTNYYVNQAGSGLSGFQGIRYQKGGSFFGKVFSSVFPFFKQLLPAIGKRALPSRIGLAQDILQGENVGRSALKRLEEAGKNIADETLDLMKTKLQRGTGRKRKYKRRKKVNIKPKTVKRKYKKRTVKKRTVRKRKRKNIPSYLK